MTTDPTLKRSFEITPAWDKRDPDPKRNYGIHGCDLRMYVTGPKGAVQFVLFTNWVLPEVTAETESKARDGTYSSDMLLTVLSPIAADLGYHALEPRYEYQVRRDNCNLLDGRPCYYDGSGLHAEAIFEVLVREGTDGVWRELETYYHDVFTPAGEDESDGYSG